MAIVVTLQQGNSPLHETLPLHKGGLSFDPDFGELSRARGGWSYLLLATLYQLEKEGG